jgi:hypothetical protein
LLSSLYILIRLMSSLPESFEVVCGDGVGVDVRVCVGVGGRVGTTEVDTTAAVAAGKR